MLKLFLVSEDYSRINIEKNDISDYRIFLDIPEKHSALEHIEEPIRNMISLYMKSNNLKLSEGIHEFSRINGSFEEYINSEFNFEKTE